MASLFDERVLEIECPSCGKKFKKKVRQLKKPDFKCPKCAVQLDTSELRTSFDKAEKVLGKLQRQLKDINITFTD